MYHSLIIRVKHQDLLSDTTTFIQLRTYSQTGQQSKFIPLFNAFASIFVLKPNQKWWGIATPVLTFLEKCQLTTRLLVALHEPGQACFLILWLLVFLHSSMMIRILISSAPDINLGMLPSVLCLFFSRCCGGNPFLLSNVGLLKWNQNTFINPLSNINVIYFQSSQIWKNGTLVLPQAFSLEALSVVVSLIMEEHNLRRPSIIRILDQLL